MIPLPDPNRPAIVRLTPGAEFTKEPYEVCAFAEIVLTGPATFLRPCKLFENRSHWRVTP